MAFRLRPCFVRIESGRGLPLLRTTRFTSVKREVSSVLMTDANVQVRRATIEDIPHLLELWQQENLPGAELEKRFKEFQVVQGAEGEVLGTIGLQISGNQGRLHSEALLHPEQADALRQKLWDRITLVAQNFGLARVWIQTDAPFWHTIGFAPATAELLQKLQPDFSGSPGHWSTLQLKEDVAGATSIDKEFALFREVERERTEKMFRQARALKMFAAVLAVAVFALAIVGAFLFFRSYRASRAPR
jgi:N-acetylglutamate synthase-like GNAT family acetyltransferase